MLTFLSLGLEFMKAERPSHHCDTCVWEFAEIWNEIPTQMGVRNLFLSLFLLLRESLVCYLGWKITTGWTKERSSEMINNTLQMCPERNATESTIASKQSPWGKPLLPTRLQGHQFCNSSLGTVLKYVTQSLNVLIGEKITCFSGISQKIICS